jgi:hypothetical protein
MCSFANHVQSAMIHESYGTVPYKIKVNVGICIYTHNTEIVAVWNNYVRN